MFTAKNIDLLFYKHPDPAWVYDSVSLKILRVNDAALERYGYSREEFLKLSLSDVEVTDRDHDHRPVLGDRDEHADIREHKTHSGETLFADCCSREVEDEGAQRVLMVARDVTRWVRLEQEIRLAGRRTADAMTTSRGLQRIAGRAAQLGAWRVELESGEFWWNEETARIHEAAYPADVSLEEAFQFYDASDQQRLRDAFGRCASDGEPYDILAKLRTRAGKTRWTRTIAEPEFDAAGRIVGVFGASVDVTEQIMLQRESEDTARRLTQTLDSMAESFFTLDHDFVFTFVNKQFARLFGGDKGVYQGLYLGRRIWDVFGDRFGPEIREKLERVVSGKEALEYEGYIEAIGRWVSARGRPTETGVAVYISDITEEHARGEQLRLLENAASRINDVLLITEAEPIDSPDGPKIVYVNDAFERGTGFSREEAIGNTPRILQGELTDSAELGRLRHALETWSPVRCELLNYKKNGEPFWNELEIVPLRDDTGWYTHWVAIQRDVTDRKATQERILESEERFRLLAAATRDLVRDWKVVADEVWWNEHGVQFFGLEDYEPGDSMDWRELIHEGDRARVTASVDAFLAGRETTWENEYRITSRSGELRSVIDRAHVIRDADGNAQRMLSSLLDVTERNELAAHLRQSQKLEAVGQLTGGVAHDFNNLLTVMLGNSEMLVERLQGHEHRDLRALANMTAAAAERGSEMTERLLAFARRQPLEPQALDFNKMLSSLDPLLRRSINEDIELEVIRAGGLWRATADPAQLEAALVNLVVNARDAMPGGGRVTIETANAVLDDVYAREHEEVLPGQYVVISVSDTGVGMSEDIRQRVIEPFFTTKVMGKGSGLGLSMVFGFVKQSGGHLSIYSEPNNGTTIRLYLPRAVSGEARQPGSIATPPAAGGSEHVLIVEDDKLVREHVISIVRSLGYRISSAESGDEALAVLAKASDVDLLFTDVIMPGGLNGRQLADIATRDNPALKVLFTSGYTENAIVHHGRLDEGVELLAKPYRRNELAAKLRKVLDKPAR